MSRLPLFTSALALLAVTTFASTPLPRSTPEAQGVASSDIRAYIEAADKQVDTMHSFLLVRHGQVVAEGWWKPEAADKPHVLHSLSKSFTSTAVGLAVSEGKLSIDDPVLQFFPEAAPEKPSDKLKMMRVRDLLTMSTGHDTETKFTDDEPWVRSFLAQPVLHKPGTHFLYNTPGTHMLSAIVRKVTGETVLDYLKPRLFEPLGIDDPQWGSSPQGNTFGGWGLRICTEDIAKFGQLYLQKGQWNGKQLVPKTWVEQATSKQVSNGSDPARDWDQGYGFQFWRCRHNAFRGDGAFGQFCLVLPEQDAVIAITADTGDMQGELNVVWDKLLPAFHDAPLPENADEQGKLKQALASLAVRPDHVAKVIQLPGTVQGSVALENVAMPSAILKREVKYSIYLPPGYDASVPKTYPVLYLLHGLGDDALGWLKKGNMKAIVDQSLRENKSTPMIIVMPDAQQTFYVNRVTGDQYEDFFFQELIPYIEKTYRCRTDKKSRAVAGLSMGGYGSLLYALHHPDLFQSCYAMSAAVFPDEEMNALPYSELQKRYRMVLGATAPAEGEPRITEAWKKNSILTLSAALSPEQKKAVRFFVDCGDDDFLFEGNDALHTAWRKANLSHEFRMRDGGHTWSYWQASLPEALAFISQGLK